MRKNGKKRWENCAKRPETVRKRPENDPKTIENGPKTVRLGGRHVEKCRFFEIRDFLNLIALRVLNAKFWKFEGVTSIFRYFF